jgi:8-oxo-dGTP pyrophosphatase MutT (NUDIX family)
MTLRPHHRLLQRGHLVFARLSRGMTLGVRAMLLDGGQVLLIKHSYIPGWYFPGGGVDAGESLIAALHREVREETGATLDAPPELYGIYRNAHVDRRDHVALFVSREWTIRQAPRLPNREIVACALFPLDGLPPGISPGTAARIREVAGALPPSVDW